jgi:hypothetical protein
MSDGLIEAVWETLVALAVAAAICAGIISLSAHLNEARSPLIWPRQLLRPLHPALQELRVASQLISMIAFEATSAFNRRWS